MRVVVVGATGNVGTSVVRALEADESVTSIAGVARRLPGLKSGRTVWHRADVVTSDLSQIFDGADAVVHLAWLFQPTRNAMATWRANVLGSMRVFQAVAEAGVPALVYASSVGAYSPRPKDEPVDESWPTHGCARGRLRAGEGLRRAGARRVRERQPRHPGGPDAAGLHLQAGGGHRAAQAVRRAAAAAQAGQGGHLPFVPDIPGLKLQVLHTEDAAEAYRLAVVRPVSGAFNLAADPVLDPPALADLLGARLVPVSPGLARAAVAAGWHLRLVPAAPGLLEMALQIPLMRMDRAREVLGWTPAYSSVDAVRAMLEGMREGAGMDTAPLAPDSGRRRLREFATGAGARSTPEG